MLSAEEPASNDQAPGPIIARVRSQQLGVQSRLRSKCGGWLELGLHGPAATRPGSDRFFREEWIIGIKQESNLCVRKSGGQIQLKTAHPRVYF